MAVYGTTFIHRYRIMRSVGLALFVAALLAGAVAIETGIFDPAAGSSQTSVFVNVDGGSSVRGSSSLALRTNEGIDLVLKTSGLTPGHVIVVKALVFNQPRFCSGAGTPRCDLNDISNPDVDGSIVFVTGILARQDSADLRARISAGDAAHTAVGRGLTNPHGADVRLIIADHGPPVPGLYNDQLSTVAGGCKDAAPGSGKQGDYACADLQFSVHQISGD